MFVFHILDFWQENFGTGGSFPFSLTLIKSLQYFFAKTNELGHMEAKIVRATCRTSFPLAPEGEGAFQARVLCLIIC
jgi:hypothetical protein